MKVKSKNKVQAVTRELPKTTIQALTAAEPSRKNIIIAILFILVALLSQNIVQKQKHSYREPSSVAQPEIGFKAMKSILQK